MDEVDAYLWEVYQREPVKRDSTGDFSWKDPAAAKRFGVSMPAYVIGGMDKDFREQLYHAGRAMDEAGIRWSILSAFRDDYRQRLATGFKARPGNSLHGGSRATGGYGHGRAVDLMSADGNHCAGLELDRPAWREIRSRLVRCAAPIRRTSSRAAIGTRSRWRCARPARGSRRPMPSSPRRQRRTQPQSRPRSPTPRTQTHPAEIDRTPPTVRSRTR